jgi:cobalt-zinc-cadmium efflux system outer membrane protein
MFLRIIYFFPAVLGLAILAGCATPDPRAPLPAVQQQLGSRDELTVTWPESAAERRTADATVQTLLQGELTTDTAVQIALLNNRRLRATFADLGVSEADLAAAGRLHNPAFAASVRWPDRSPRGPNVEFSLVADLLDDLLIPLRKKFAREQLAQAVRRVAQEVLALAADVRTAVYTAEARQLFWARLSVVADVNAAAADLAQRQYDAGNINQLELAGLQLAASQAQLEVARTDAQFQTDREKINRLLGLSGVQAGWKLEASLPALPREDPPLAQLEDSAVARRLDLALAKSRATLAASAYDLKRRTRLLPAGVSLGLDTERESRGDHLTGPRLELALPLFDQGQADLVRLGAETHRAQANAEALAIEIRSEVRETHAALLAARATAVTYEHIILPQRKLILRETLLHYNAMQKSNYELLAAKERELVAERDGVEARRDYWIARVRLETALGGRLPGKTASPAASPADPEVKPAADQPAHHSHS